MPVDFGLNDFVLVSSARFDELKDKTMPTWRGPYRVTKFVRPYVYEVKHVCDVKTGACVEVHARHLKRYADASLEVTPELKMKAVPVVEGK